MLGLVNLYKYPKSSTHISPDHTLHYNAFFQVHYTSEHTTELKPPRTKTFSKTSHLKMTSNLNQTHGDPRVPNDLVRIDSVPPEYIQQIWSTIWPALCVIDPYFQWDASSSNVRLFNDIVRAVLYNNLPLPRVSEVADLVNYLLLFSLNPFHTPNVFASDNNFDSSEADSHEAGSSHNNETNPFDDAFGEQGNPGNEGSESSEGSRDTDESDDSSVSTETGSRLPFSLQMGQPVLFEQYAEIDPDVVARINLDGEDILIAVPDLLETFHIVDDNGRAHPMTRDELNEHRLGSEGVVRDVEIRPVPSTPISEPRDFYDMLVSPDAVDHIPYEEVFEDTPRWREMYLPHRRREENLTGDYCQCYTFYTQTGEGDLARPYFEEAVVEALFARRLRTLDLAEGSGRFPRLCTRHLLAQREARFLAGLDTSEMDREITRRILQSPLEFSVLRDAMSRYFMELYRDGDNYRLT